MTRLLPEILLQSAGACHLRSMGTKLLTLFGNDQFCVNLYNVLLTLMEYINFEILGFDMILFGQNTQ